MKLFGFEIRLKIERKSEVIGINDNEKLPISITVISSEGGCDGKNAGRKGSAVKEKADFQNTFLTPHPSTCRCQTYINKSIYRLIKRFLPVIAPDMSITAYINNVLSRHLEDYKEEINDLYIKKTQKPLWKK